MTHIKVSVVMESSDAGKIVEVDLSRDDCESIYALGHVLGKNLGQLADDVKAGMAAVLASVPKTAGIQLTVPFTSIAAANVAGMCSAAIFLMPAGPHREWVDPVLQSIRQALRGSRIRAQVVINAEPVFSSLEP
jgi:hypothetical protein